MVGMWKVSLDGESVIDVSNVDLVAWLQEGRVPLSTLAWAEGMAQWVPVADIPSLRVHVSCSRDVKVSDALSIASQLVGNSPWKVLWLMVSWLMLLVPCFLGLSFLGELFSEVRIWEVDVASNALVLSAFFCLWFVFFVFVLGGVKVFLEYHDRQTVELVLYFSQCVNAVKVLFLLLLLALIGVVGGLGLVLPGVYLVSRLWWSIFEVIDTGCGVFCALSRSWRMTRSYVWKGWMLFALSTAVLVFGVCCFYVGLVWALPLAFFMQLAFFRLQKKFALPV